MSELILLLSRRTLRYEMNGERVVFSVEEWADADGVICTKVSRSISGPGKVRTAPGSGRVNRRMAQLETLVRGQLAMKG